MSLTAGKRKRDDTVAKPVVKKVAANQRSSPVASHKHRSKPHSPSLHIQVVTGSYERVLHGFVATFPASISQDESRSKSAKDEASQPTFTDTFLFAAHSSAIRCLAVSPPTAADKRLLATGSTDERINVYSVSTTPPESRSTPKLPSLSATATNTITENPRNRALGSLVHHDRAISTLHFASKSKLFSGAEDSTIAISRTRDWTMLSSIKAPIPKAQGRPSGDTAAPGDTPAGINDFAIHPSQKLMISVGRGERCMRLWNLMTGKKAGVLNFDRHLLTQAGETKFSSGEGRKVLWNASGDQFVVGFERGAILFGIDSQPRAIIRSTPSTKFHQMRFIPDAESNDTLCISTEDGRLLFFRVGGMSDDVDVGKLPACPCVAQLGGRAVEISGRIKDFDLILPDNPKFIILVTASSDGAVRFWKIDPLHIVSTEDKTPTPRQIGELIGTLETGNRITCVGAFIMDGTTSLSSADNDQVENGEPEDPNSSDSE